MFPEYAWRDYYLEVDIWRLLYEIKQVKLYLTATLCSNTIRGRLRLKCDGTRAETRFRLSAKRTSPFKSAGALVQSTTGSRGCASAVVMLNTPWSEVVWRVLATHSIRQFPLNFPSRASPCAITFQLDSISSILQHDWLWDGVFLYAVTDHKTDSWTEQMSMYEVNVCNATVQCVVLGKAEFA